MANSLSNTPKARMNFGGRMSPATRRRRTSIGRCSLRPRPGKKTRLIVCLADPCLIWQPPNNQLKTGGQVDDNPLFQKPTKDFEDTINQGRFTMTALPDFTPLQGGVPIIHDGQVIGAIGCSGAKSAQQDEEVAKAGAAVFTPEGQK